MSKCHRKLLIRSNVTNNERMTEGPTTNKTKIDIVKFTDVLAQSFSSKDKIDILAICEDEGISIITDNYNNYFDGMLVWDGTSSNIDINSHK
jgi:hypothetical protein